MATLLPYLLNRAIVSELPVRKPRHSAKDKSPPINHACIIHIQCIDRYRRREKHPYRHESAVDYRKHIDRQAPRAQVPRTERDLLLGEPAHDEEHERDEVGCVQRDGCEARDGVEGGGGGDVDEAHE